MRSTIGRVVSWIGVLWLAAFGVAAWGTKPPEMLGLAMGQVLVGIATLIALGLVLSSGWLARGANDRRA